MHATCFSLDAKQEIIHTEGVFGSTIYSLTGNKKPGRRVSHPHQSEFMSHLGTYNLQKKLRLRLQNHRLVLLLHQSQDYP